MVASSALRFECLTPDKIFVFACEVFGYIVIFRLSSSVKFAFVVITNKIYFIPGPSPGLRPPPCPVPAPTRPSGYITAPGGLA
jgi:hypothetical protein